MRRILIMFPFILMHALLNAQGHSIGLRAGATSNASTVDLAGRLYEARDRHWGLYLNMIYRYSISNKFDLESGMSFVERNYGTHRTGVYQGIYSKTKNSFIDIPLKAVLRVIDLDRFNFKISGGGYGGYWVSSQASGALPNILNSQTGNNNAQGEQLVELTHYNGKIDFNSLIDNRFHFGCTGGWEMSWTLNKSIKATLNCDLYYTFSCHEKRSSLPKKSQRDSGVIVSAGAIWSLSHSK